MCWLYLHLCHKLEWLRGVAAMVDMRVEEREPWKRCEARLPIYGSCGCVSCGNALAWSQCQSVCGVRCAWRTPCAWATGVASLGRAERRCGFGSAAVENGERAPAVAMASALTVPEALAMYNACGLTTAWIALHHPRYVVWSPTY